MNIPMQPFEAHIPYVLQFMIDYNLHGMNFLHAKRCVYRAPLPLRDQLSPHVLVAKAVYADGPSAAEVSDRMPKDTTCLLELDIVVEDITNHIPWVL